jgi:multiple sugar transport system substrate-binding protein
MGGNAMTKPSKPSALSRRELFLLAAASGGALSLGTAFAQDRNAPESLRRSGGGTPVQFRAWERYPAADIPGLNKYLDQHPNTSIEWVSTPFARYRDRMIAEFIAATPLDVVQIPETELAAWADSGWLLALESQPGLKEILDAATPAARDGTKGADGKTYAIPYLSDAFGFAYDKEALSKGGFDRPAQNLDELRNQMQALKKAGVDEYPLSLAMKKQPGNFWSLWATLYASGGDLFDADNNPVFDKPGNPLQAILEWYAAAMNDWKIVGPEDLQRDWGASRTGIRTGIVKFGYMAQYALAEFNVWPDSKVAGRIRMALVPGIDGPSKASVSYAHSVGIAATSKQKDSAWNALRFYAGQDGAGQLTVPRERLLSEGGRSPFPALYRDPAVESLVRKMTGGDTAEFLKLSDIAKQRQGIKATWYPEWENFMMTAFQDALQKRTTVKDAVRAAADEARRLRKA